MDLQEPSRGAVCSSGAFGALEEQFISCPCVLTTLTLHMKDTLRYIYIFKGNKTLEM